MKSNVTPTGSCAVDDENEDTVESLCEQLRIARQHFGFDLADQKAGTRSLLRERILPLVSDAIDALEIDNPAPHVALSRLRRISALIATAASKA